VPLRGRRGRALGSCKDFALGRASEAMNSRVAWSSSSGLLIGMALFVTGNLIINNHRRAT
jgi:hypothetical protein